MARALTSGDGPGLAALWEAPAMIIEDQAVIPIDSREQVEQLFAAASQQYSGRGIADARPEVARLTWPTERMAVAEVRWSFVDGEGRAIGEEVATYTLRRADDGRLRARVLLSHGAPT
jgi:hypothetical protein